MRSRKGRWNTGLLERHLRIVLAGLIGVERLRSGTTSGADSAGLRIWTCFPLQRKKNKQTLSMNRLRANSFIPETSLFLCLTFFFFFFNLFAEQHSFPSLPTSHRLKGTLGFTHETLWHQPHSRKILVACSFRRSKQKTQKNVMKTKTKWRS